MNTTIENFHIDTDFVESMNRLSEEEAFQLESNLLQEGCRDALVVWQEENLLLDGHNRLELCKKLGLPYETHYLSLPDRQAAVEWICKNQLGRRNLTPFQKAEVALKFKPMLAEEAKERQKAAGKEYGKNHPKEEVVAPGPQPLEQKKVRDELAAKANVGSRTIDRTEFLLENADQETIEKLRTGEASVRTEYERLKGKPHIAHSSGDNEWYTPEDYIERVRRVLGRIDLDPASCVEANKVVRAERFFTEEQDGLQQPWSGTVWMNPPYSQPEIRQFCDKLVEAYRASDVTGAVVLVNNATETGWGQTLLDAASAVCFPKGRLKFWHPDTSKGSTPLQGQMVVYFGKDRDAFCNTFNEVGVVR